MVYQLTRVLIWLFMKLFFFAWVEGADQVPKKGAVILASNHLSILDPILMVVGIRRPVAFIAREDLFHMPLLSWLLPRVYAIPVERGSGNLSTFKAAIRLLRRGMAFGIFPEGTRARDGRMQPFKTGAAAIAMRTGALVVPVAVINTERAWPVGRGPRLFCAVRVVYGAALDLSEFSRRADKESLIQATKVIEAAILRLLPPRYHVDDTFHKDEDEYKE